MKKAMIGMMVSLMVIFTSCQMSCNDNLSTSANNEMKSNSVQQTVISAEKPTLCLIGDSRVEGIPTTLFSDNWNVSNFGVGGTTSYHSACVAMWLTKSYDAIIISVGINDYYGNIELEDSIKDITSCCQWAKLHSEHVYLTTIPGIALYSSCFTLDQCNYLRCRAWQINYYIPNIAQNCGVSLIPLADTLNTGLYLRSDYADQSGIHYNTLGYQALHDLYETFGI